MRVSAGFELLSLLEGPFRFPPMARTYCSNHKRSVKIDLSRAAPADVDERRAGGGNDRAGLRDRIRTVGWLFFAGIAVPASGIPRCSRHVRGSRTGKSGTSHRILRSGKTVVEMGLLYPLHPWREWTTAKPHVKLDAHLLWPCSSLRAAIKKEPRSLLTIGVSTFRVPLPY